MKYSLKSLLVTVTVAALICAVALISYRRGRQDEKDSNAITGDWVIENIGVLKELNSNLPDASGDWNLGN